MCVQECMPAEAKPGPHAVGSADTSLGCGDQGKLGPRLLGTRGWQFSLTLSLSSSSWVWAFQDGVGVGMEALLWEAPTALQLGPVLAHVGGSDPDLGRLQTAWPWTDSQNPGQKGKQI